MNNNPGNKRTGAMGNIRGIRPPLSKKSFTVHRPGGLKRAYWNFFIPIFKIFFFFLLSPPLYILVFTK